MILISNLVGADHTESKGKVMITVDKHIDLFQRCVQFFVSYVLSDNKPIFIMYDLIYEKDISI